MLSDLSVKMLDVGEQVWWVKIISASFLGLVAVIILTIVVWVLLLVNPYMRKAFMRIFGEE